MIQVTIDFEKIVECTEREAFMNNCELKTIYVSADFYSRLIKSVPDPCPYNHDPKKDVVLKIHGIPVEIKETGMEFMFSCVRHKETMKG